MGLYFLFLLSSKRFDEDEANKQKTERFANCEATTIFITH